MKYELSGYEQDALNELANMGVGRASAALAQMVEDEIELSLPKVSIENGFELFARLGASANRRYTAVCQEFHGGFGGLALLVLPERKGAQLARALLREDVVLEVMTELEESAFLETGNIILNSALASFADGLDVELETELPVLLAGEADAILAAAGRRTSDSAPIFLHVDFFLSYQDVRGAIAILLDVGSLSELRERLARYLARIGLCA